MMSSTQYKQLAIPMIIVDNGSYKMTEQAYHFLRSIPGPIGVVSVAGVYRTGKSYLLNRMLLNRSDGFGVGSTVNSCTKGLWCWGTPIKGCSADGQTINIIIVDTQGINALDEQSTHDVRVFTLAILASSCFIYNSMGSIDQNAIQNLSLVTNLTKHIQLKMGNDQVDPDQIGVYFPSFFWVVRDFSLQLVDPQGKSINSNQYLQRALTLQKGFSDDVEQKNRIRRLLTGFFKQRNCFTLIRPLVDETKLQNLDKLDFDELRPDFVDEVLTFRKKVINKIKVKTLNGKQLNGEMYANIMSSYVKAINQGAVPNIENAWVYMCMQQSNKVMGECMELFMKEIKDNLAVKIPCSDEKFNEITQTAMELTLDVFRSKSFGESSEKYIKQLKLKLKKHITILRKDNEEASVPLLKNFMKQSTEKVARKLQNSQYKTYKEYLDQMNQLYDQFLAKGPNVVGAKMKYLQFMKKGLPQGGECFFRKILKENANLEKLSKQKQQQYLKEIQELKKEKGTDKKNLTEKLTDMDKDRIQMIAKIQRLQFELERVTKDKQFQEQNLSRNLSSKQIQLEKTRGQLQLRLEQMSIKYQEQTKKVLNLEKQWEKQEAIFDLKFKQQQSTIEELQRKEKLLDSNFNISKSQLGIQLKQTTAKLDKRISQLEYQLKDTMEQKTQITEQFESLKEQLEDKVQKFDKKQKKYKQQISTKNKELEKTRRDYDIDKKKIEDEHERSKDSISRENNQLQLMNNKQEENIKNLAKMLKDQKDRYERQNDLLKQQLEFAQENMNRTKQQLIENKQGHESAMAALEAQQGMQREQIEKSKIRQLKNDYQREMSHLKQQYNMQYKSINNQLEKFKIEKNECELNLKLQIQKYNNFKIQSQDREKKLTQIVEKLQSGIKSQQSTTAISLLEKDAYFSSKIKDLESEIEQLKQQCERQQKDAHGRSEDTITHLKNYYQLQKEKLEQKIISDKQKHQRQLNQLWQEYEKKRQQEIQVVQQQNQQLKQDFIMMQQQYKKTIQDMQHDIDLKAKDIENIIRTFKEFKQTAIKKETQMTQKYQTLVQNSRNQRDLQYKKIQTLQIENNKKDKDIMSLTHQRDQLNSSLQKKQSRVNEIQTQIILLKQSHIQINDHLKQQLAEKEKDYLDKKATYEKNIALANQENQFFTKKVIELENQFDHQIKSSEMKMKNYKEQSLNEFKIVTQRLQNQKNIIEQKFQKVKKNKKQNQLQLDKKISEMSKQIAVDQQKITNLQMKCRQIEDKRNHEINVLEHELIKLKQNSNEERNKLQEQLRTTHQQLALIQNEKNQLGSIIDRERLLSQNKIKFLEQSKEQIRKEKDQICKRLETTIQSLQRSRSSERSTVQSVMNETIAKLRNEYQQKVHDLGEKLMLKTQELDSTIKKYEIQFKNIQEKLAFETQARINLQKNSQKKINDLIQIERITNEQIDRLKTERQQKRLQNQKNLENEKQNFKKKLKQIQEKCRFLESQKQQQYYENQKQKAKWKYERESINQKMQEFKEKNVKYERQAGRLQRDNERLKNEKKTAKAHSFINKWNNTFIEEKKGSKEQTIDNKQNIKDNQIDNL